MELTTEQQIRIIEFSLNSAIEINKYNIGSVLSIDTGVIPKEQNKEFLYDEMIKLLRSSNIPTITDKPDIRNTEPIDQILTIADKIIVWFISRKLNT